MKNLFAAVGLFTMLASSGLKAQTLDLRAYIPFEFQMGNTSFPPGAYEIHSSGSVLRLNEVRGNHSAVLSLTNPASRNHMTKDARLDFNRYGEAYFLAAIWAPEAWDGRVLPKTPRERRIAKNAHQPVQVASISLEPSLLARK
jgi:hypothetical protein